jgi:hypothetical protein
MNSEESVKYLTSKASSSQFNYRKIKDDCVKFLNYNDGKCIINFILTARGRVEFTKPMYESFLAAQQYFGQKVCFTIVEHSEAPMHAKFYKNKPVNYIYINSTQGEQFNKCLSYNIGALLAPHSEYFIFHDLDILIKEDFFNKVLENLKRTQGRALQCYSKRRVLNCDVEMTEKIINGEVGLNSLEEGSRGINLPMYNGKPSLGSKGGSILLDSALFFDAGGYDPELFRAYSAEDNFFWEKVSALTDIGYADEPAVEILHMWHEPQFGKNPFLYEMERDYLLFKGLPKESKIEFINEKRKLFTI